MSIKLIRTSGVFPPGGYQFVCGITGKKYDDMHTTFDGRVSEVIRDRLANQRLFTDSTRVGWDTVSREISEQICSRLRGSSEWCVDDAPKPPVVSPAVATGKVCRKCSSTDVETILCKTCGGSKISGYKCRSCGADIF